MKVDVRPEVVQWMLRTWESRLINTTFSIMLVYAFSMQQRVEPFLTTLKSSSVQEFNEFWMEFFSKKKMEVLCQEALEDTHLPLRIENEAAKDNWLKWLETLDLSDEKDAKTLAGKCFFVGEALAVIELVLEEIELQSLQNTEEVCFALVGKKAIFEKTYWANVSKNMAAKHSASYKTKQVDADRASVKAVFEKWRQKNCPAFRVEAMLAIDKTDRTVQNRLKEVLKGQ